MICPLGRISNDAKHPHHCGGRVLRHGSRRQDFLPRALYGDYLQEVLAQAEMAAPPLRGDGEAILALSMTRELTREVESRGGDWREVVTFIRHLAPALWRRLPLKERQRFVRHLQTHWDIHRHRLPPQLAERIESLRRTGKLQVNAGRIELMCAAGQQLRVTWRPRGGGARRC